MGNATKIWLNQTVELKISTQIPKILVNAVNNS